MKGRRSVDSHYAPTKIIIENAGAAAAEGGTEARRHIHCWLESKMVEAK